MPNIITTDLRRKNIENFLNNIQNESTYFCFSNPDSWNGTETPTTPADSFSLKQDIYTDMLYGKRVVISNASHVIPNYSWVSGEIYQKYSDSENISTLTRIKSYVPAEATATLSGSAISTITVTNGGSGYTTVPSVSITGGGGSGGGSATATILDGAVIKITVINGGSYETTPTVTIDPPTNISNSAFDMRPMYVITDELNVYKCIDNNSGTTSTVKPSSTSTSGTFQAAGATGFYTWKYMYTVSETDLERFYTSNWIPVKTLTEDDGSLQWDVQTNAGTTTLNAPIGATGSGYTSTIGVTSNSELSANDILIIGGSEQVKISGATGFIGSTGIVVYRGLNNTTAGATGVNSTVFNLTGVKHGKDAINELNASNLMVKVRVTGSEGDQIVDENEYRQISLLNNPVYKGSVYYAAAAANPTLSVNFAWLQLSSSHDVSDSTDYFYPTIGKKIIILDGTGKGQIREISNYNTNVALSVTVTEDWDIVPDSTSLYGIISTSNVVNQTTILELGTVTNGPFIKDSTVTQASTLATGKVVKYDSTTSPKKLFLTSINGNFDGSNSVSSGSVSAVVSGVIHPKLESNTGNVLYIENRKPITRYPDQVEDIKVIVKY